MCCRHAKQGIRHVIISLLHMGLLVQTLKLYLPNKGNLAEANQACNQNHHKASKVVF